MTQPVIVRGHLVTPDAEIPDGVVAVENDMIVYAGTVGEWRQRQPGAALPEPVGTVLPGLVDIHCHGGGGKAVTTTDADEAAAVAVHHAQHGTTSLMASLVTAPRDVLLDQVRALLPLVSSGELAGLHLEGPFLSPARCGAQSPEFLIAPDIGLADELLAAGDGAIKVMTLAPELTAAPDVATRLCEAGVTVALGHSDASYTEFRQALRALDGLGLVTHLGNGMPAFHHRSVGPVGASLVEAAAGHAVVEVIGDGVHVDPGFVALVFAIAATGSVVLVTDAMAAAGMSDGDYELGAQRVQVRDGVARLSGESAPQSAQTSIAGGTSHLVEVVARTVREAGVPLVDAVTAASRTPARVLGVAGQCGALEAGLRADLVVVDADLRPVRVMRRGQWLS
jgi:N-acetylglucosamine-6-phosphate deacetylase